jgi:hypothetical protein
MFATPNGEKREESRQATRAAENLRLADCALIQEVRDHHRELARHYLQLAEKEKPSSVRR